jgi:glycolate oxidase FAD binding subunit
MNVLSPTHADEVPAALAAAGPRVRVRGSGSRQDRLPDAGDATILDLARLDSIERLDAADQTCTVGAGVRREVLDQALAEHRLELGCLGDGTLGGLCAFDPLGPASPGAPAPRSLLLGMSAVLVDGTVFRSGARVVKNVAGFDLHKLFVGSRGTLCIATHLHLRLRPQPRTSVWFASAALSATEATTKFTTLRNLATPPAVLRLERDAAGRLRLTGRLTGRANFVAGLLRSHALAEAEPFPALHVARPPGGEVVHGNVGPSQLTRLFDALPVDAELFVYGGGRCELACREPAASDRLLATCATLGIAAAITCGAPARRGVGTRLDAGATQLSLGLKRTLDPDGKLV